jgi:hypothetical protein
VRERDLYKSIKSRVTTTVNAVEYAEEIQVAARDYAALLNSGHEYWDALGTTAKRNVETLLRLELEQNRPLLLAVMRHFAPRELRRTLRALVSWSVRGLVVGGIGGGTTERAYSEAAVRVRNGSIKTSQELLDELGAVIPGDGNFGDAFRRARVSRPRVARYLLLTLERAEKGEAEPELVPNENEEEVNLEHILPRNAREIDWAAFSADDIPQWVTRIGNFALLQRGPNDRIGNKPWTTKQPVLASSALDLTKRAAARLHWDESAIADRQAELAALAVKAWPRAPR